jgi:FkbM family methyltransferase
MMKKILFQLFERFGYKNTELKKSFVVYNDVIGFNIINRGFFELDELELLKNSFKESIKSKTFLDIGANVGNHSVFFSSSFKSVKSFEPQIFTFKILEYNTKNFSNIEVLNYGIDEMHRKASFFIPNNNKGGASEYVKPENYSVEEVELRPIPDEYFTNVGYVKIDVEGNEYSVLKSIKGVIMNSFPIVSIELGDKNKFRKEIIEYMSLMGYNKIFYIPEDWLVKKMFRFIFNLPFKFKEISTHEILSSNKNFYLLIFLNTEKNNDFKFN